MKIGLTLGKFAPFHKGHQLIIETALSEVDKLFVMVYHTELISIPLQIRAGWIKNLYPQVKIIEAWDGPDGYGNTAGIKREQENYILKKLDGQTITHFYSSEFYGEHVSVALNAVDRRVDETRKLVPISGTLLRQDYFKHREFISERVYRDLILNICFLGAPSTGKTTIVKALAKKYKTVFMPEYGAEYLLKKQKDRRITLEQFEEIAPEHIRREDEKLLHSNKYLFSDTCPITTFVFAKDYHGAAGEVLTKYAQKAEKRYDIFFLCGTDIPYDETWDRSGNQKREWFQKQIIGDLKERRIPFILLEGDLEARIARVGKILSASEKYNIVF